MTFTPDDLRASGELAVRVWAAGVDGDWSVPAGTLEWTCRETAVHVIDAATAPALFLASGRRHDYPPLGLSVGEEASPADLVDCLRAATAVAWSVVACADPGDEALILRRTGEVAPAADFAPRCALELLLHTHDVAAGLGVLFEVPHDLAGRLRDHSARWRLHDAEPSDDPWHDVLTRWGRS